MAISDSKTHRISALDFTKGGLVLFMVLYHWINYFVQIQGFFYRYLRFLTPSFIFITGFMISSIYLSKYGVADPRLPQRLMQRGLKILGIFVLLNVGRVLVLSGADSTAKLSGQWLISNMVPILTTGNSPAMETGKLVAFYILVPIGYLLLLSACLMIACRIYKHTFYVVCILLFLLISILDMGGFQSANLELITIGLLGVLLGYVPMSNINSALRMKLPLFVAYLGYLVAITLWNVVYLLQVVGVPLSVGILYVLGSKNSEPGRLRQHVVLLGRYSLFGYIAQIAILQLLRRGLGRGDLEFGVLGISFIAAFGLTMLAVEVLDRARAKTPMVDSLYKAVFS